MSFRLEDYSVFTIDGTFDYNINFANCCLVTERTSIALDSYLKGKAWWNSQENEYHRGHHEIEFDISGVLDKDVT